MSTTIDRPEAPVPPGPSAAAAETICDRLFREGAGAFHLLCVYLGDRLGLYRALADGAPRTAAEVAAATGLDGWYVREWLQAETTAGLVTADGEGLANACFSLADGVGETLVDETSPHYLAGLATAVAVVGQVMPSLVGAFHTGEGVPSAEYGPEAVDAQAALNRPAYANSLVPDWLPAIPDVLTRLTDTARPARIADIGCGAGWASIELAKAFPHLRVDGFDNDEESIRRARRHAADHGVSDRVDFEVVDASSSYGDRTYDAIFFFECLHDLAHPVEALASARRALAPGGVVVVMDERVGETPPPPGDAIETFFATASVLWCLPQSRAVPNCQATGTVMRPEMLRTLAERAGYSAVDVLPVDHPFFRFYHLAV